MSLIRYIKKKEEAIYKACEARKEYLRTEVIEWNDISPLEKEYILIQKAQETIH
jgi:hypothetical protein